MSGEVHFRGDAMAGVVAGLLEVQRLLGTDPVLVGGLAVLSRLTHPHRATVDVDVVDRLTGPAPYLQVLRAAHGATPAEPAAVLLPTEFGEVKVDVLEVRQVELDEPSDDPGDRLHVASHAWANDMATSLTLVVTGINRSRVEVTTPVAEAGPLVAMKLQAVMNRGETKQATDLLDIIRMVLDPVIGRQALDQIGHVPDGMAADIRLHADLWFQRKAASTLQLVRSTGEAEFGLDDIVLVGELLTSATSR